MLHRIFYVLTDVIEPGERQLVQHLWRRIGRRVRIFEGYNSLIVQCDYNLYLPC